MKDRTENVEHMIRTAISEGSFTDMADARDAVRAWLTHSADHANAVTASLKGDMTEDGDAEYQDQAMRSVDA